MEVKYPTEYELDPERIDEGIHSITMKLRNIGNENFKNEVDLDSLDSARSTILLRIIAFSPLRHGKSCGLSRC
jgi:hypothetical protein